MAIALTDNFGFPLPDTGAGGTDATSNWGAVMNGMMVKVDRLLAEARNPLIWDGNTTGRIDGAEILAYDGDVLLYA